MDCFSSAKWVKSVLFVSKMKLEKSLVRSTSHLLYRRKSCSSDKIRAGSKKYSRSQNISRHLFGGQNWKSTIEAGFEAMVLIIAPVVEITVWTSVSQIILRLLEDMWDGHRMTKFLLECCDLQLNPYFIFKHFLFHNIIQNYFIIHRWSENSNQ